MQYLQDSDERYPPYMMGGNAGALVGWSQFVQPYVKSNQVFACPSDATKDPTNAAHLPASLSGAGTTGYVALFPTSYGMNSQFTTSPGNPVYIGILASQVANAASTVMITDGVSELGGNTNGAANKAKDPEDWTELVQGHILEPYSSVYAFGASPAPSAARGGPLARHLGMTNVAYADGHVKSLKIEKWYYSGSTCMTPATGCA